MGTGKYIGCIGVSDIGADDTRPVVATDEPFKWDIWPDDKDWFKYRCASHCPTLFFFGFLNQRPTLP
jgi:hypothetical protein